MPALIKRLIKSGRGRLSRRIVFWVFISVIVIETIILIPSFNKREKELVSHLKEVTAARVQMLIELSAADTGEGQIFERITRLHKISGVLGGALYRSDGTVVGIFGESPSSSAIQPGAVEAAYVKKAKNSRYDFVYRHRRVRLCCDSMQRRFKRNYLHLP